MKLSSAIRANYAYMYRFAEPVGNIGLMDGAGSICGLILCCTDELLNYVRYHCKRPYRPAVRETPRLPDIRETPYMPKICKAPYVPEVRETPIIREAASQLAEYFGGKRRMFDLPLAFEEGYPEFTVSVLKALLAIPPGHTLSYGEVAGLCGNAKASRAVGMVNNRNPIPIIIPCHRVVGGDGSLTGYAGGLALKRYLLDLERKYYM